MDFIDIREKKTIRSIRNAFLQLRAHKQLERITVKELAELAEISKATFYLHYKDIYDLSDSLENEVILNILNGIAHPETFLLNHSQFMNELIDGFHAQQNLIDILFSGSQANVMPNRIEQEFKQYFFQLEPKFIDDIRFGIQLTYQIYGGYHAYIENRKQFGDGEVLSAINELSEKINRL